MSLGLAPLGTVPLGTAPVADGGGGGDDPVVVTPALHTISNQFQPGPGIGQGLHAITEQVSA